MPPWLFNLHAECIMQNARLNESQAGIKIARSIYNLRYEDDTTLMAESKEELRASWWRWKRRVKKLALKLNIQKTKFMASSSINSWQMSLVQMLSRVRLFATPWTAARQASLSITNSQSLLKLMSIELVMPSNHLILCCPLLLLPSIFPSIRVFSNESIFHVRWQKYWSFSFSIRKWVLGC